MADEKEQIRELAEAARQAQSDLANFGRITQQTQDQVTDAQMKAKHGINNFTAGTSKASEAVFALGAAGMAAGKAMLDGKKGAAAFNSSLDSLSAAATAAGTALALMIPGGILIKGLIAGITMATTAYIKYTQAANEMADQLHKGYQGLAKAGGAAADGMTGLKNDAQKLGLAMGELDQLVSLVAENSKDFALFAGSVSDGRKRFADMGQAIEPARAGLMNMGLGIKDINEGMAGYVKLQTRLGNAQQMSVAQLAKGAQDYLKEQDMLTKLTGQSRAEMEQQRERALQKEQFAAKVRELQLAGNKEGAEALLKLNSVYEAAGPEMASAFQASVTGNLSNADAQKANLASNGEMIRTTQQVIAGQISYQEAAQRTGTEMGKTADTVGTTLGQLGAYNNNFGNLSEQLKLAQMANGDIVANSKKIQDDQKAQIAGADPLVKNQTAIVQAQIAANKAMTDFVFEGIVPAQKQMKALAEATGAAARGLADVVGGKASTGEKLAAAGAGATAGALTGAAIGSVVPLIGTAVGGAIGAVLGGAGGYMFAGRNQAPDSKEAGKKGSAEAVDMTNIPMAADGGFLTGPISGYLAMLHGNELVIPEDQLKGKISSGGMAGAGSEQLDKMNELYKEMFKDTQALEKLTDQDLKKTKDFSRLSDRLRTLKTQLMGEEIEMLEEQNDILEKMVETVEKVGGKEAGTALRKNFAMMRSMGGGAAGMGGAGGISMPSAGGGAGGAGGGMPNLPSMGGGQGFKASSTDLLQFGGASGSASNFEALDGRLKEAVINAASEYNSLTGNKLKINSAKRDSDDQIRLYQETVDAGRPGIGPNGMPVGRPGTSSHEKGLAVDIQNYNDPAAIKALNGQGLQQVVPKDPVHFQLSGETGMIADGPETGYQATLHGKEAVIPMQNNSGDFVKMFEAMAEGNSKMVAMMEEMVRAQKSSVDVQTKMLRAQS
jgi:hypothetical protein